MKAMLTIQGFFYLITGIWPLISIRTFEWVTGPKLDQWLLMTVGLLVASSGMVFLYTAFINPMLPDAAVEILIAGFYLIHFPW